MLILSTLDKLKSCFGSGLPPTSLLLVLKDAGRMLNDRSYTNVRKAMEAELGHIDAVTAKQLKLKAVLFSAVLSFFIAAFHCEQLN